MALASNCINIIVFYKIVKHVNDKIIAEISFDLLVKGLKETSIHIGMTLNESQMKWQQITYLIEWLQQDPIKVPTQLSGYTRHDKERTLLLNTE